MWQLAWFVFTTIVSELLRPKPANRPAASLGDFNFPTAEDGRPLPIVAGTVLVSGHNVVWYGDLRKSAIRKSTGLFSSTTVGHRYYLGFQAAICQGPIDALVEIEWGKKPAPYSAATVGDKQQLTFALDGLFGGKDSEGGISGVMDFYLGTSTQAENDYLLSATGEGALPGYRNVCMAIARQMYLGTSKYVKQPAFVVQHFPNTLGLTAGRHIVNGRNANAAAFLYWLLTDVNVGVQFPAAEIDTSTFIAVGNTTYSEGLGVNFTFDQKMVAGEAVDEILRHIDGFRYVDPLTGLFCIGLIRDDYTVADLPVFDGSNILGVDLEEASWADQINYVTVEYLDSDFKKRAVPYPNLAAIERRGEIEARTYQYLGLDTEGAARLVAARLSKRQSYPLKSGRFILNGEAWNLHEGSVFLWSGYPLEISSRVMRVVDVEYGSLESGEIVCQAVEDIFSVTQLAYGAPTSDWTDPVGAIAAVDAQSVLEVPYHFQESAAVYLWVLGVRSSGIDTGMQIWTDRGDSGSAWEETNTTDLFCPSGTLESAYDPTYGIDATGFTLEGGRDLEDLVSASEESFQRGQNLVLIGDELFAWRDVTDNGDGTYTFSRVIRAVLDTVPRPHSLGDRAYFLTDARVLADPAEPISPDQAVGIRLLPYNGREELAFSSASTLSITTASRASRPYPPGNFRVNGSFDPGTVDGDLSITWAHRNRTTQTAAQEIVEQDDAGSYSAEGDYQLEFWIDGAVRRTVNPAGGDTSYSYTAAMRQADYPGDLAAPVEVRGYSRTGGSLLSAFYQSIVVDQDIPS
jgi:hypothetical protein